MNRQIASAPRTSARSATTTARTQRDHAAGHGHRSCTPTPAAGSDISATAATALAGRRVGSSCKQWRIAASHRAGRPGTSFDSARRWVVKPHQRGLQRRVTAERQFAGDHLEKHHAEGVAIARRRDSVAAYLLGRHVGRRADHRADFGQRAAIRSDATASQAEVGDHRAHSARVLGQDDVAALEVPVQHPGAMRGVEAFGELLRHRQRGLQVEGAEPRDAIAQGLPGEEFHAQEMGRRHHAVQRRVAMLEQVVNATDVQVRNLPRGPHFAPEALEQRTVAIELGPQQLHRHRLVELQVVGLEHLAVRPGAQKALDPKPLRVDLPEPPRGRQHHGRIRVAGVVNPSIVGHWSARPPA